MSWLSIQWLQDSVNQDDQSLLFNLSPSTLVCGTACFSWMCKSTEKEESFFFYVLYTRRPWCCDGLWGLYWHRPLYRHYSTFCLRKEEMVYWLATLTRTCVGPIIMWMNWLQWQGQVKLEQRRLLNNLTWELRPFIIFAWFGKPSLSWSTVLLQPQQAGQEGRWMGEGDEM